MSDDEMIKSHASALGKRAAGVPKVYTPEELERRRAQMQQINATRTSRTSISKAVIKKTAVTSGRLKRMA